jgi:hypothetical protein
METMVQRCAGELHQASLVKAAEEVAREDLKIEV